MSFKGVTGSLNLLTEEEMVNFGYDKAQMLKHYGTGNIQFTKILSIDEKDMLSQDSLNSLLNAAAYLDDMVNNK